MFRRLFKRSKTAKVATFKKAPEEMETQTNELVGASPFVSFEEIKHDFVGGPFPVPDEAWEAWRRPFLVIEKMKHDLVGGRFPVPDEAWETWLDERQRELKELVDDEAKETQS